MDVLDFLERAGCATEQEFMERLRDYPTARERRIIMSRIGLLPYLTFAELGANEDVTRSRARQCFLIGLRRMREQKRWGERRGDYLE